MIDIIIPVLNRPQNAEKVVDSIFLASTEVPCITFVCSPGDAEQIGAVMLTEQDYIIVDFGHVLLGFLLIGVPLLCYWYAQAKAPNPFGVQLYHLDYGLYTEWWRKHHPKESFVFQPGQMVKVTSLVPPEGEREGVLCVEPKTGRQAYLPPRMLRNATNLAAYFYYKEMPGDPNRQAQEE